MQKPTVKQLTQEIQRLNKEIADLSTSTFAEIADGPHHHLLHDVFITDPNGELFATRQIVNAELRAYYARTEKIEKLQHHRSEVQEALAQQSDKPKPRRKRLLSGKQKAIRRAITKELKGADYCRALGDFKTPEEWQKKGCPAVYTDAYRQPEWQIRIQQEKYREHQRMMRESNSPK